MVPDELSQSLDAAKPLTLAYIGDTGTGKSCHLSCHVSAPQLQTGSLPCLPHFKRQLDCFIEGNRRGILDPRHPVLQAPGAYENAVVTGKVKQRVAALSTEYKPTRANLPYEIIHPLFSTKGNSGEVNSEVNTLRLPSKTGRYQLLVRLSDSEGLMDDFRLYASLHDRHTKALRQLKDDLMDGDHGADSELDYDETDSAAQGANVVPLTLKEEATMLKLRSKLEVLLQRGSALDELVSLYLGLNRRTKAFRSFQLPWIEGLTRWFNTSVLAHGATSSLYASAAFSQDLITVLTSKGELQPLLLGDDGLRTLLTDLDRQEICQGRQGMWQALETRPQLRQAVASLISDGTIVLFEPQRASTQLQLLPPLQWLSILDTMGTGDPNCIHAAHTQEVQLHERHAVFFRKNNLLTAEFFASPLLRRAIEDAVLHARGSSAQVGCSAAILISTDTDGYDREMQALGLGKHPTIEDLARLDVCETICKANFDGEENCKNRIRDYLRTRMRVKGKRLTPAEQEIAVAALPVVKGPFALIQALLTQRPQFAVNSPAAAKQAIAVLNLRRFRWVHLRPLAMAAQASLEIKIQQLEELITQLGGATAINSPTAPQTPDGTIPPPAAAAAAASLRTLSTPTAAVAEQLTPGTAIRTPDLQQQQHVGTVVSPQLLLLDPVRTWLSPLTALQPLRKLHAGFLLRQHGVAYLKQCLAVVRQFRADFEGVLKEQLQQAAAAAAPNIVAAIKQELADRKIFTPARLLSVLQQALLPTNKFAVPDVPDLDIGWEYRWLIEKELEQQGLDVLYARLQQLHGKLLEVQHQALVGLQLAYAEMLGLFDLEQNAAAKAALQALQDAAARDAPSCTTLPPPAAAAVAAAAPPLMPVGTVGTAAAAAHANANSGSRWPAWPAVDSAAPPELLISVVKQFFAVLNGCSGFHVKASRACSSFLFAAPRLAEQVQKDYFMHRKLIPHLAEAWPAATAAVELAAESDTGVPQNQGQSGQLQVQQLAQWLVTAVAATGRHMATLSVGTFSGNMQQSVFDWALLQFPVPVELEGVTLADLADNRPAEEIVYSKFGGRNHTSVSQQQQQPDAQIQPLPQEAETVAADAAPARSLRTSLIGSAVHAMSDTGSALLGLEGRSVRQQHSPLWRRGELQRLRQQAKQQLDKVRELLDPVRGPELYPLPDAVATLLEERASDADNDRGIASDSDCMIADDNDDAEMVAAGQQQQDGNKRCRSFQLIDFDDDESVVTEALHQGQGHTADSTSRHKRWRQ